MKYRYIVFDGDFDLIEGTYETNIDALIQAKKECKIHRETMYIVKIVSKIQFSPSEVITEDFSSDG